MYCTIHSFFFGCEESARISNRERGSLTFNYYLRLQNITLVMQGDKNDGGDNGVDSPGVNRIVQFSATEDQINPRGIPTPPGTPPSSSSPITPSKSPRLGAKSLRANLTRELRDKDPLFYYEVISVLGTGSMGSVLKVRKKDAVKGGSARQKLLGHFRRERLWRKCFSLPLLGGILQYFLGSEKKRVYRTIH